MNKNYQKQETLISISLIIIYVISNSYCMKKFGLTDYRSTICNFILSSIIIVFIIKNKLAEYYGLTKLPKFKEFLYFIPLILIIATSLLGKTAINNSFKEIIFYIIFMIEVGFLEEIIFRGFLFKMMEKDNVNQAIIVTSLTFGIGHIVNLLNGAPLVSTLVQICYSITIGFLFVTIFQKGKSLWPCIVTHILINSLAIFSIENIFSLYIIPVIWIIISILYSIYIIKNVQVKI